MPIQPLRPVMAEERSPGFSGCRPPSQRLLDGGLRPPAGAYLRPSWLPILGGSIGRLGWIGPAGSGAGGAIAAGGAPGVVLLRRPPGCGEGLGNPLTRLWATLPPAGLAAAATGGAGRSMEAAGWLLHALGRASDRPLPCSTLSLVASRSRREATNATPSALICGMPTRPMANPPKKDTLTLWQFAAELYVIEGPAGEEIEIH